MYKCCVFDLDGTIADTINSITYFGNTALKNFGLPEISSEKYKYLVGDGYKVLVARMLKEFGLDENHPIFPEIAKFYHDEYDKDSMYLTKAFSGMPEVLKELKDKGMKLAVLSNKPQGAVDGVVKELYGENLFDLCYGYSEGVKLKPDTTLLSSILEKFGAKPEECVYVGDTATDMKTGKGVGAYTIGVLWGFRKEDELLENGADKLVSDPVEILEIINGEK